MARSYCPACGEPRVRDGVCYACEWSVPEARSLAWHLTDEGESRSVPPPGARLRPAVLCDGCGGQLMNEGDRCTCGRQLATDPDAWLEEFTRCYDAELARRDPVEARRSLERRWLAELRGRYAGQP